MKKTLSKGIDIVIVGAGPAGITAAIYAKQDNRNFRIFESKKTGWFAAVSADSHYFIDGFPGTSGKLSGSELMNSFNSHLKYLNIKVEKKEVVDIKRENKHFKIFLGNGEKITTKTVILATGTVPKRLNVKGEKELFGKGVSNFCTVDGDNFKGKKVVVVGGRNSGAVASIYLHKLGAKVVLVERDECLNAKAKYLKKIYKNKIDYELNTEVIEIIGSSKVEAVSVFNNKTKKENILRCDGVFVYIGLQPNNYLAKKLRLKLTKEGYVKINDRCETSLRGIYAAGDITGNVKQIVVACGQGAVAAYNVNKYLLKS
ncbi:FAD-dependent oxidoreductase [Patescibacteria group bacterium]|nr:FAD-dependent oxidoreductase [Patescibacteria group bacterium]